MFETVTPNTMVEDYGPVARNIIILAIAITMVITYGLPYTKICSKLPDVYSFTKTERSHDNPRHYETRTIKIRHLDMNYQLPCGNESSCGSGI